TWWSPAAARVRLHALVRRLCLSNSNLINGVNLNGTEYFVLTGSHYLFWNNSFNTNTINWKLLINDESGSRTQNQAFIEFHGSITAIKVFQLAMSCRALINIVKSCV